MLTGVHDELEPARETEPLEDDGQPIAHGRGADVKRLGDLPVGQTLADEPDNLMVALTQRTTAIHRRIFVRA
jgi:hypothetical protein